MTVETDNALPERDKKQTLCWFCRNTRANKCCWFKNFTPVAGWDAVPTTVSTMGKPGCPKRTGSYLVMRCPNFEPVAGYEHFAEKYKIDESGRGGMK